MSWLRRLLRRSALLRKLRLRTMSWDVLWARADAELATPDLAGARETYQVLSHRRPSSQSDYLRAGLAAHWLGETPRAFGIFQAGHVRYPTDPSLAELYLRLGGSQGKVDGLVEPPDATAARQIYRRVEGTPADHEADVAQLRAFLSAGLQDVAEARIAEIARTSGDLIPLWKLSDELLGRGDTVTAAAIYRQLAMRVPENPVMALYVALALERLGAPEKAVPLLEAEWVKYPEAAYLREQLVRICFNIGDIDRVIRVELADLTDPQQGCEALFSRFVDITGRVKLIEHCIAKGYRDPVATMVHSIEVGAYDNGALWQLADTIENKGLVLEARRLQQEILRRPRTTALDGYFAAAAALRLGDADLCMTLLESGLKDAPGDHSLRHFYTQLSAGRMDYERYMGLMAALRIDAGIRSLPDFFKAAIDAQAFDAVVANYKDIQRVCTPAEVASIENHTLAGLKQTPPPTATSRRLLFYCRYLDLDERFSRRLWDMLRTQVPLGATEGAAQEKEQRALEILFGLTPPMIPSSEGRYRKQIDQFIDTSLSLATRPVELDEPIADLSDNWTPWQYIFCTGAMDKYGTAVSALERVAFATWPRLNQTASHVTEPGRQRDSGRKIRIGFIVHDSMPMMSGLLAGLDNEVFETVFLRPGAMGKSRAAQDWVERAGRTVEFSNLDSYAAIDTIAAERLDIIISGPSVAAIFFPMMARLAPLQMVLLEPNWTDGFTSADYYISWKPAEPDKPEQFYKTSTALLDHPPYFIERHGVSRLTQQEKADTRERLLKLGPDHRVYLCANTPPKIHPDMDGMLLELLERDPVGRLVILRSEYPPSKTLRIRLQQKLGNLHERVIYLPTLKQEDAHRLLLSADCCLDSFPLCGMSSSFDAAMIGVPLVTLPTNAPFGKWTATMYEYIGVSGLTAKDQDHYLEIALRLAKDWREEMSADLQVKATRFVESEASVAEFREFIEEAWARHQSGLPPASWSDRRWQGATQAP